jgi:hypothetical protein
VLPPKIPSWRLHFLTDGLALIPPSGVQQGAVRIRERLRPLRSAREIFAEAADRMAGPREAGPIEQTVTVEGELAAVQVIRHTPAPGGGVFFRVLGVVFGDDFYCLVDGGTALTDRFDFFERAVRVVTAYSALGLGHRRVRRFPYAPPAGWQPSPRGLDTVWRPSADETTAITAFAARPAGGDVLADVLAGERLRGLPAEDPGPAEPAFTDGELSGRRWKAGALDVVLLEDDRFVYPILARNAPSDVVDRLVRTVRPVPLPEPRAAQDAMLHWST